MKNPVYTRIKNLIANGQLDSAEYVDNHNGIYPALLLRFKNGYTYPVRKEMWKTYKKIIPIKIVDKQVNADLIYFRQFKLPHRSEHFFHLIHETKEGKLYFIHTSGVLAVKYKNGKERLIKGTLNNRGHLVVKIEGKTYKIKNLVAAETINGYKAGMSVIMKDGNPTNCDCYNLKVLTPKQLGTATGGLTNKSQKVMINGKIYNSIRQAALSIYVSPQSLSEYLRTGKSSIIDRSLDIKLLKADTKWSQNMKKRSNLD